MKIEKDKVVSIHYTLTGDDGEILDSSRDGAPLSYIQGMGNIIPGLESALEGKNTGDHLAVTIAPENGYGRRNPDLVQKLPRDVFREMDEIEVGGQFLADTGEGEMLLTITAIGEAEVMVDGNHPLAGATLHFDVDVAGIRNPSPEELEHGHPHEEDGCEDDCGGGCSCN